MLLLPQLSKANTYSGDFDSTLSQYGSITDGAQSGLDILSDITMEAWVHFDSAFSNDENRYIIAKFAGTGNRSYSMYLRKDATGQGIIRCVFSNDGTSADYLAYNITLPSVGTWTHYACAWDSSASAVEFYENGVSLGIDTGSKTSIYNSNQTFTIGANGVPGDYWDGGIDEVRIWNDLRTDTEISDNYNVELTGTEAGLVSYWQFENDLTDTTSTGNDLTNNNSITFSTDVPFTGSTGTSTATSTIQFTTSPDDLDFIDDIGIITGLTIHYETSTTTADWYEKHYYRIPLVYILIFWFLFLYVGGRILLEFIIRWRQ